MNKKETLKRIDAALSHAEEYEDKEMPRDAYLRAIAIGIKYLVETK